MALIIAFAQMVVEAFTPLGLQDALFRVLQPALRFVLLLVEVTAHLTGLLLLVEADLFRLLELLVTFFRAQLAVPPSARPVAVVFVLAAGLSLPIVAEISALLMARL